MSGVHKTLMLCGAAAVTLSLGGCHRMHKHADVGAIKTALQADEKKWNDQFKAKDLEGLVGHYSDDAFFIAPGLKSASGSTAIRKDYADGLADKNFDISFASDKIDVARSGDLAYARGHFSGKYTDPKSGQAMSNSGSYLTVYKMQPDGSWKAVEDFAAADPGSEKPIATAAAKPAK